jgi:hypothetical protein
LQEDGGRASVVRSFFAEVVRGRTGDLCRSAAEGGVKLVLAVGVLWPFVLVAGLLATLAAGEDVSDGMAYGALSATALGVPAIGVALYRWLPSRWSEDRRVVVAGLLTLPLLAAEVFLALVLLAIGMHSLGFAPA